MVSFGGSEILTAQPDDLIIYKFVAWRDRDKDDIERLLLLYAKKIDLARVRGLVREFSEVLEDPQRVEEFEAMVERALKAPAHHPTP